jgi:NAD(P)-dependent dehydrogenase (short-subunit alcohol dehydrogenase family)
MPKETPSIPYPGRTGEMDEEPRDHMSGYRGSGLLEGKKALVTGGDSGIGRAVSVAFAKEGADVGIAYLEETDDAETTSRLVEAEDRDCVQIAGDLGDPKHCGRVVDRVVAELGGLDILVNNAGYQWPTETPEQISDQQLARTFTTNVFGYFFITRAALAHIGRGGAIVNTASVNGLRGNPQLVDYSATKGAVVAWTYALAQSLVGRGIRVNCVAPGPVWTPLIPSTFAPEFVESFGRDTPMRRPAQPDEIAPSYVFFAAEQMSSYYTGEVLAPTGGEITP